MMRRFVCFCFVAAVLGLAASGYGYSTFAKWSSSPVTVFVNPANADLTASATVNALQYAMDVWNTQSGSSFRYQYGGTVSDTATAHDNRNVMIFRNASNGSTIGTTYSWWDTNNRLLDSDVIFWDANFKFFAGSGCGVVANAVYLEDIATHELGHVLGLNHSSYSDATMYPSYSYCSQALRTLAADDVNAMRALYPATTSANVAPTVVITSPANGATFSAGASVSLAGTGTDKEDGTISSKLQWTDNGATIGSGALLSTVLSLAGTHTIKANVTDSGALQGSSQVSITITVPKPGGTQGTLTLKKNNGFVTDGSARVYLYWTGVSGLQVDVYRNGVKRVTTNNDGSHKDYLPTSGSVTYVYKVCTAGTQTCTNSPSVSY